MFYLPITHIRSLKISVSMLYFAKTNVSRNLVKIVTHQKTVFMKEKKLFSA